MLLPQAAEIRYHIQFVNMHYSIFTLTNLKISDLFSNFPYIFGNTGENEKLGKRSFEGHRGNTFLLN